MNPAMAKNLDRMSSNQITPAMARRIEIWPTERLIPYQRNARTTRRSRLRRSQLASPNSAF